MNIREIAGDPDAKLVDEIARVLTRGGVALLPTETIYGLHACADHVGAIKTIDELKGRDEEKPFVVLCSSIEQAIDLGAIFSPENMRRMKKLWPAPLTAIVPSSNAIAASKQKSRVAIRISPLLWLRRVCESAGPIASTSANVSGEPAISQTRDLPEALIERLDLVVDAGRIEGASSTIIDLTGREPAVVREGAFSFSQNLWKTL